MTASADEAEPRASDEVTDRRRNQDFVGVGLRHHEGTEVDGGAVHFAATHVDFPGMDTRPHRQTNSFELCAELMCGFDGTPRPIEDDERSVGGVSHHATAIRCRHLGSELVAAFEQRLPPQIADLIGALGGINNVREQD